VAVRTKQLFNGRQAAGGAIETKYTCPAARTAIVKDWTITNEGTVAVTVGVTVRNAAATEEGWLMLQSVLGGAAVTVSPRFAVLEPGDELRVFASSIATGAVKSVISGSELDGVA